MNKYFVDHPEMILGNMEEVTTQYGKDFVCKSFENTNLEELLDIAIQNLNAEIDDYQIDPVRDELIDRNVRYGPEIGGPVFPVAFCYLHI